MKSFRIILATEDNLEEVVKVFRISFNVTYPNFLVLHTADEDFEFFKNTIFKKDNIYLAEEIENKKILGFIAFNSEFIDHLYLLPEAQKQGIGSELIDIAKSRTNCLKLWTFQQNTFARSFYKTKGFKEIKFTDGSENEEKQPDVLMEWRT
jgi:putative acetyltransferase